MSDLIQLDSLPVETLAEMANEAAAACEASGRKTVEHAATCGRALLAIRLQIPHGEWLSWLANNFSQSQVRAHQYMEIANYNRGYNLEDATSIRQALRLIAESPEKQAKKQEREAKKQEQRPQKAEAPPTSLAPATPVPPVSEGIIRNENPPSQPQRPEWLADPDELERPEEDDLPPLPRTNTHHTAQNRRTPDARETDRAGIVCPDDPRGLQDGKLYVWSESANRLFLATACEIRAAARELRLYEIPGQMVVEHAAITSPVVEPAKESVSSKPGKVPTLSQLLLAVEGKTDWTHALRESARDWAAYKMTLAGKDKIRSMESWQKALTRMGNVARDRDVATVCEAIEKAIANGWTGWEHLETSGSRGGSRISTAVRSNRNWDEEIPEWKPNE